uniref:Uncharacterized protein n=1 Tax=Micrurus surinamensis TaxID=129470 RepID=A0A2D4PAF4_MICSU
MGVTSVAGHASADIAAWGAGDGTRAVAGPSGTPLSGSVDFVSLAGLLSPRILASGTILESGVVSADMAPSTPRRCRSWSTCRRHSRPSAYTNPIRLGPCDFLY